MANTYGNPWNVDTVGLVWTGGVYIKQIRYNTATATDYAVITNGDGTQIAKIKGQDANGNPGTWYNVGHVRYVNPTVSALPSGSLTFDVE